MRKRVLFLSLLTLLFSFRPALAALGLNDVVQDLESLSQTKEVKLKSMRYFRLTGNDAHKLLQLQALTLVLNNLSLTSQIFYPELIDKNDNSIVRIDLSQLGNRWISEGMKEGLWTKLVETNYPYVEAETKAKKTPLAQIIHDTQSPFPLIRADWFIWKSGSWNFYAAAMGWPKTLEEFRAEWSSKEEKSIARQVQDNSGAQALFLGQNNEQISFFTSYIAKTRLYLERQSSRDSENANYVAYVEDLQQNSGLRTLSLNKLHKNAKEAKKSSTRFVYILRRNGLFAMAKFNNGKLVTDSNSSVWDEIDENHPIDILNPATLLITKIDGNNDYKKKAKRFFGDGKMLSYHYIARKLHDSAEAYHKVFEGNVATRQKEAKETITDHLYPIAQVVRNYIKELSLEQIKSELEVTDAELKSVDLEKAPKAVQSFFQECGRALCRSKSELQFSRSYLEENYRALRGTLKNETYERQPLLKQNENLKSQKSFETLLNIAKMRFDSIQEAKAFLKKLNIEKTFNFRRIEPGSFLMGSPDDEQGRIAGSEKQHFVKLKRAYEIGLTEVTQGLWVLVMGKFRIQPDFQDRAEIVKIKQDDGSFENVKIDYRRPVENVTWVDIQKFVRKLNQFTGQNYRLPTEQEWEYAARAGTTTPFNFVKKVETSEGEASRYISVELTTNMANFSAYFPSNNRKTKGERRGEFREATVKVASFPPNKWGLYDMSGNVWEWVLDCFHDNDHQFAVAQKDAYDVQNKVPFENSRYVIRGGAWDTGSNALRSAARFWMTRSEGYSNSVGFRLVRTDKK